MPRQNPIVALLVVVALIACGLRAGAGQPPSPAESLAALRLADPDLKVELVASEPAVVGPVAIAWDELGRLYVAEMSDYPVATTRGRIKRLEDRDGDGRYEIATVFADGLPYPSGVLPWDGGVLVTAAPDLLFLKDNDGDGRADVRRVVLTGFAEGNTQLRVNSPTWGRDNWVYLANGRSGGTIRRPDDPPERSVAIPRNDLRVRPDTGEFEPVAGFSQFGLPRDDWGDRFPSWNTVPLRHVVLEDRRSARTPGSVEAGAVAEILDMADGGRIFSLAPAQTRFNAETVAFFNATCGPTINRGDLFGGAYRGHAFVCEPLTSVVHHRRLDPAGPTFVARRVENERGREFLASTHPWFRPVNLASGPDGALYVVDFCRALVEHPDFVPEALRKTVDFREGHDRGRLWRVAPVKAVNRLEPCRPGADTDIGALVAHFAHPNGWCRDTAQRLLVGRRDPAAIAPLKTLARSSGVVLARVHALWTLDGLNALDLDTLRSALRDADPHVREQAARLVAPRASEFAADLVALTDDPDVRVRLRTAVALDGLDSDDARVALARLAARDADSSWMIAAILGGIGENPARFLNLLSARPPVWLTSPTAAQVRFLATLAERVGAGHDAGEVRALTAMAAETRSEAVALALVHGLDSGLARKAGARPPLNLDGPSTARVERVREAAAGVARADDRPAWLRVLAFSVVLDSRPAAARVLIPPLLEPRQPVEVQAAAARGLARLADPVLAAVLLEDWDRYALGTRRVLLGSLARSVPLAEPLVEAVARGKVAATEVDPATRDAIRRLANARLLARFEAVFRTVPNADRGEVIRRYEPALELRGDAVRGRDLFARYCQTCHARNGLGSNVGPDLISVAGRPGKDLLVAILDPSREVAPDSVSVVVATTRGQTLTGLLAEETPVGVRLRRAEGVEETVPRGEIESMRPTGRSLMPDGFEVVLNPENVADLIAFLHGPASLPAP